MYDLGYPAAPAPGAPPRGAVDRVAHLEELGALPALLGLGVVDLRERAGFDMRPLPARATHGAYRYARYRSSIYARYRYSICEGGSDTRLVAAC